MTISPLAGKPATKEMLVDLARLEREYYARVPDPDDPVLCQNSADLYAARQ